MMVLSTVPLTSRSQFAKYAIFIWGDGKAIPKIHGSHENAWYIPQIAVVHFPSLVLVSKLLNSNFL